MKGFGGLKPKTGDKDNVKLDQVVQTMSFPDKEDCHVRFLPTSILPVKQHWVTIMAGKGGDRKAVTIPKMCVSFNPETEENDPDIDCPYCRLAKAAPSKGKIPDTSKGSSRASMYYLANAIVRSVQEEEPAKKAKHTSKEKETGFKSMDSKSWTPVRVLRITPTLAKRIQVLNARNKVSKGGKSKVFDITDPKFGQDLIIRFDKDASGSDMYSADPDVRAKLSKEELDYLKFDLSDSLVDVLGRESLEEAEAEFERMEFAGVEDQHLNKKKKSANTGIDIDDDDEDEEEEDDKPAKKKKKSSKSSEKSSSKSKKKPVKKKRPVEDDDDEEDDKPAKKKKKSSKSSEKSSSKSKKKPAKKKKKESADDWDDWD